MTMEPVTVSKIIIEKTLKYKDIPVLHYKIEYPRIELQSGQLTLEPVNQWYRKQALELKAQYETDNYAEAVEMLELSRVNDYPFHMFEAMSVYDITYNQNEMLSLYYDHYTYSGGAHGSTRRVSDTWSLKKGCRIGLDQFSSDPDRTRQKILAKVNDQISVQMKNEEGMYFDDYIKLTAENYDPDNFYITPEGLVIYYQQYDIAPYASGIPEFILPWKLRE